ncbi:diguanylate cyclase (GGDEF) domain-containing protein [Selenomonas ruminantium]|uniref:Diguanylate cyclase (GGDEF) domain-containing protein n=1 Tax=Selenomonas ruminantium TaxID=971 RepID=A0A1I3FZ87_SELRU|nr:GGDEF and EAL domain-containing protein [Selenomonas ruminantium]MBQ1890493.1 GGDEF and EAL domain-containing protein [Selenomonas sp.]SFI16526.1 diguanylate cyclase (GGDEF) domain-containing protein [Selenomonas ruminantium]
MKKNNRIPLSPCLKRFKFYFDLLKKTTNDYLFFTDIQENIVMVSPNLVQDFDLPGEVMENFDQYWGPLVHPEEREEYAALAHNLEAAQCVFEHAAEYRVKSRKGEYVWIRCRGRVGADREGRPSMFVGMMSRMAQRNQADEITGLLNKYQFEHAVKLALAEYRATGDGGAIMVFGLDNFKIVNETYNRLLGDQVLKRVARVIANVLPPALTLFKLDGDEFAVIYPGAGEKEVGEIFASVQSALSRPQDIDGHQYFCTASCGTVFYPTAGKDYLVLHKHAEAAMDIAKREGKNRNVLFSKEEYNRWVRSISMRDSLWESVENGCTGFSLFFQPQVSAVEQKIIGAEALLRWKNPKGRMVAPMEFIPILEETKLIIPVGKWIFAEAVRVCKRWREVIPEFRVSINMSYEQVKDLSFKKFVADCLQRYEMPPEAIILELTESKIVADWSFVNKQFDEFRQQGLAIAMDDFGTGYSSLASLKYLSCDIVKIDREFVKKILENDFDRRLVKYVVSLCHSIGIKCCIEGVEELAEYELLTKECQADSIQGYLFGHPESVENFEEKFLHMEKN